MTDNVSSTEGNPEVCAPNAKYIGGSCIDVEVLESMVVEYNNELDNAKININTFGSLKKTNPIDYKRVLVKKLRHALKEHSGTKDETEWLNIPFIKNMKNKKHWEMLKKFTFKPTGPKNTNEWLNTMHINEIFAQYEKVYKDFKFYGAVPRDFDDLDLGIKEINYKKLVESGITQIGFVFNLDKHNMPGSHWVALHADLKGGIISYIDSVGDKPAKEFLVLMKRIEDYIKTSGLQPQVNISTTQHQYGNSECGVYSCYFLLRLLKGESFQDISAKPVPDAQVKKCRLKYFR